MCPHTPFGNVKTIKQHYQCRTEQRIAQEVCGHVHQYGRIRIFESDTQIIIAKTIRFGGGGGYKNYLIETKIATISPKRLCSKWYCRNI